MAAADKNKIPVNSKKDQSPFWMLKTNAKRSKEATLKPSYATDKRRRIEKISSRRISRVPEIIQLEHKADDA